jgi:hypothetical protein
MRLLGGYVCRDVLPLICKRPAASPAREDICRSMPSDDAAVDLALAPIQPAAGQFVARLEGSNMLLPVTGGLGVQGPDNLCAVAPIAGPMRHAGFRTAETVGRAFRIAVFVLGVADQDHLAADVGGQD